MNESGLSAGGALSAGANMAQREKYWTERDRDEKFEALREHTVQLLHMVANLQQTVQALLRHQHSQGGELMTPMDGHEGAYPRHSAAWTPMSLSHAPEGVSAAQQERQGKQESQINRAIGATYVR